MGRGEGSSSGLDFYWRRGGELLHHPQRVELVPGFDDLAVLPAGPDDAGQVDGAVRGGDAEAFAGVGRVGADADDGGVALGDDVLDRDANVGEGGDEAFEEGDEALAAFDRALGFGEAV